MAAADFVFKVIVVGDSGVGKTNLLLRYTQSEFDLNHASTLGVELSRVEQHIDGDHVMVDFWDTAGYKGNSPPPNIMYGGHALNNVEFCTLRRRLLAGDWPAPKTLSKIRKISLVVFLVVGSVQLCHQICCSRLLENFTPHIIDNQKL